MSVYEKIKALNIELPPVAKPVAAYVMYVQSGNLVYLSGHIARKDGKIAARNTAIDMIATLQDACGGDLKRVKRIVKGLSLGNSTGDFTGHHLVTNGASELLVDVFGDAGRHARSAFGVAQLPTGAFLELELIAEID